MIAEESELRLLVIARALIVIARLIVVIFFDRCRFGVLTHRLKRE